ncbi:MAG: alcohol dehydrogenase catalytic domain-containing protein [Tepidanaerobacteraceae bacterium]|jgi:L-iditol 2-dehydrogenase
METMRAAIFEKVGTLIVKEVPIPKINSEDEILLKVNAVSVCGTDVHIVAVPPGYTATDNTILGHELVGTVMEKGALVTNVEIGDHVVVNPNNYCGCCSYCRKNMPNLCQNIEPLGIDYDGAFAEYCVVKGKVAYKISKDVSFNAAACAEPLACAINGLNKVNIKPGDSVAIVGAGPIGMMIAMLVKASGAGKIYHLEVAPYRISFLKNLNVVDRVINPIEEDAQKIIKDELETGVDFVFDVTGSQICSSLNLVRRGGTVVLFGVNKNSVSNLAQSVITTNEVSVIGTWLANATFPQAVKVLEQKVIDVEKLVTDVIPLKEIHNGIEKLAKGQAVKVIVKMD